MIKDRIFSPPPATSYDQINILVAEDDPDDQLLTREAFEETHLNSKLFFVENGEELMDFLYRRGKYSDTRVAPKPGIILLDLNMPKKDGREALKEIRANKHLRYIPVIALTTSKSIDEVNYLYELGVNSFITKPVTFDGLVKVIETIGKYWLQTVRLPCNR